MARSRDVADWKPWPVRNIRDFPIENGDFPINNGEFSIEIVSFPIINVDFP